MTDDSWLHRLATALTRSQIHWHPELSIEPVIMGPPVKAVQQAFSCHLVTPFPRIVDMHFTLTYGDR
jgi:hypothetical protein